MSPHLTNPALTLTYAPWSGPQTNNISKWSVLYAQSPQQPHYTLKRLNLGYEYELHHGVPQQGSLIGEVTVGKIALRGSRWYADDLKKKRHGLKAFFSDGVIFVSPLDGREYMWETSGIFSTSYVLKDVQTKEHVIETKGSETEACQFAPQIMPQLEFWLLTMMQYRLEAEIEREKEKERQAGERAERNHERARERAEERAHDRE